MEMKIDCDRLQEVLKKEDKNRALEVLQHQLKQYRNILMPDKEVKPVLTIPQNIVLKNR